MLPDDTTFTMNEATHPAYTTEGTHSPYRSTTHETADSYSLGARGDAALLIIVIASAILILYFSVHRIKEASIPHHQRDLTLPHPIIRIVLFTIGWINLILGVIGLLLPLVPTTPFLIISAYCFSKSSRRIHAKLLAQPYIGPIITEWENNGCIKPRVKVLATVMICLPVSYPLLTIPISNTLKIIVFLVCSTVLLFIWTRPSLPSAK